MIRRRLFLLSPANLAGTRGRRILEGSSGAPFMPALRDGGAVPLGDVYAFISSLYYRGKRTYARTFGAAGSILAITSCRGLVPDETLVTSTDLAELAEVEIDPGNPRYRDPLLASVRALDAEAELVLLGSIATGKYLDPVAGIVGRRLLVPESFVGRGDMSRGGLLLRAAAAGVELDYVVAVEAERTGPRPPRLDQESSA